VILPLTNKFPSILILFWNLRSSSTVDMLLEYTLDKVALSWRENFGENKLSLSDFSGFEFATAIKKTLDYYFHLWLNFNKTSILIKISLLIFRVPNLLIPEPRAKLEYCTTLTKRHPLYW
jgi:hypothetical protein